MRHNILGLDWMSSSPQGLANILGEGGGCIMRNTVRGRGSTFDIQITCLELGQGLEPGALLYCLPCLSRCLAVLAQGVVRIDHAEPGLHA